MPYISRIDVAEVAVRAVTFPAARNTTIIFSGPEAISQRDAVRMFEEAIGKPLTVTAIPAEALEGNGSRRKSVEKIFAGLMLGIAKLDEDTQPLQQELGFEMETVREFAKKASGGGAQ